MAKQKKRVSKRGRINEGRPLKYDEDFHPENFVELSKQGKTTAQITTEWDINPDTFYDWVKKYKKFSDFVKKGRKALEAWFTNFGMDIASGKVDKANVTAYIWLTKNCINWSDKQEVKHSVDEIEFSEED